MKPDTIIQHCSATRENTDFSVEQIDAMHQQKGFKRSIKSEKLKHIGYHYYVRKSGKVYRGRYENEVGAHCLGWNDHSIGICYEGGLDINGKAKDTRTTAQKESIRQLVNEISSRRNILQVIGHRDTSPDLNGNGIVDPGERLKECPCFDVKKEFSSFLDPINITG